MVFPACVEVETHLSGLFVNLMRSVGSLRVHGDEVVEAVAAVDVQQLAVGSEAVGGIYVAAVLSVEVQSPVVPVGCPEVFEVVEVRPFYV